MVSSLHCMDCDTTIQGRFYPGVFSNLSAEQIDFVEIFIKNEGKLNRMSEEMDLSYPTLRNRLHEVIRSLGYEPGEEEPDNYLSDIERKQILEDLDIGNINYQEAMKLLKKSED